MRGPPPWRWVAPASCPVAAALDAPLPLSPPAHPVLLGSDGSARAGIVVARRPAPPSGEGGPPGEAGGPSGGGFPEAAPVPGAPGPVPPSPSGAAPEATAEGSQDESFEDAFIAFGAWLSQLEAGPLPSRQDQPRGAVAPASPPSPAPSPPGDALVAVPAASADPPPLGF